MVLCTLDEAWGTSTQMSQNTNQINQTTQQIDVDKWEGFKQLEHFDNYSPTKIVEMSPQSQNSDTENRMVTNQQFRQVLESQPTTPQVLTNSPTYQTQLTKATKATNATKATRANTPIRTTRSEHDPALKAEIDSINRTIESIMDKLETKSDSEDRLNDKIELIMTKLDDNTTQTPSSNFNRNVHDIILFIIFGLFVILIIDGIFKVATKTNKKYLVI